MDFEPSARTRALLERLEGFMAEHVYSSERRYFEEVAADRWGHPAVLEELKAKAMAAGLWNLFLPDSEHGAGLANVEYAPLCEVMGRVHFSSQVFNCSAPDTGNIETLIRYGSEAQKTRWLPGLLAGETRSAFAMTEPEVASSDATNIRSTIRRDGDDYIVNGHKWWISGVGDSRCQLIIFLGVSDSRAPKHKRHSMILVPRRAAGVEVIRPLTVFGYDDAPHGHMEMVFDNVRVPAENMLLGEGRGFEIAQGRLGPGRIHHCMRLIGLAERCLLGFNSGPPVVPAGYNQNLQIFQTPDHVVILHEMVHDARVVPLDGRPHLPEGVRQWMGDSRGYWDGDTLVVESRNYSDKTASFSPSVTMAAGDGTTLSLTERFTRVAEDTLLYEFTVDDATTFTAPITAQIPMKRGEAMFEYACHEGNYGLPNILAGARQAENAAR